MGKPYGGQSGTEQGNMVAVIGPGGNGKARWQTPSALSRTAFPPMWRAPAMRTTGAVMVSLFPREAAGRSCGCLSIGKIAGLELISAG